MPVSVKPVLLVYLHGFNSSPASYKARLLHQAMCEKYGEDVLDEYLCIPEIPPAPLAAIQLLMQRIESFQKQHTVALAGSSLGAFYATWLAEHYACRAVLINPAVRPHLLLEKYLGENINYYTSEHWVLDESHIEQFREFDVERITRPERYLLMIQKGDETLDYREALEKYRACPAIVEEGGNHSFVNFEQHIDRLLAFCGIPG